MKSLKFLSLGAALMLAACGEVGDATSGTNFRVTDITLESDSVNTICASTTGTFKQADSASVGFENTAVGDSNGATITIKSYTLNYAPIDGGPALTGHNEPIETTLEIKSGGSLKADVWAFPISTKTEYQTATTNTTMYGTPKLYRLDYEFVGETEYHDVVKATASTTVQVGNTFAVTCK